MFQVKGKRSLGEIRSVGGKGEKWSVIARVTGVVILLSAIILISSRWFFNSSSVHISRAAIVDGIGFTRPNPSFIEGVRGILEGAGLKVDVYEGESVTIDLLRRIGGYGLLILRLHSAVDAKYGFLYLFSAEEFNKTLCETKFSEEYSRGVIREGITFEGERYFTLRADLLGYMSQDGLSGSIVILMGCNGTNSEHAIDKLLHDRGVKAVIAWDGYVDLNYTDEIILKLIENVYEKGSDFEEAVNKIMDEYGPDPIYKSKLRYLVGSG